ncbi:hypothetical protein ONS96_007390 [Cadophora gregata f. sp. sojae]|nr:hypothetical protein ONS96_007390 [Cadophora gregata f. sp. sojae]
MESIKTAMSELEIVNLLSKYEGPKLTFGLEMELDFAIDRKSYFDWLDTNPSINPMPAIVDSYYNQETRKTDHWVAARNLYNTRVATGLQQPSPTFSETSRNSHSTSSYKSDNLRHNLLHYFVAFLNRELPSSKPGKLLIGDVPWGGKPKTAAANTWTLVADDSLIPSRETYGTTFDPQQSYKTMRKYYRCVGAELVSKVYDYDKLDSEVLPALRELHDELQPDYEHGVWFTEEEHLHVHFALKDEEVSLELAQTLCVLYGLFENQIETFVQSHMRESSWCVRLREGMSKRRFWIAEVPRTGNIDLGLAAEGRYTPRGFADAIYATKSLEDLRSQISGYSAGEEINGNIIKRFMNTGVRNWVALNVSMSRLNKPTTFEFRQHHGVTQPVIIKYWVEFCGHMVTFAHLLVKSGIKLQDPKEKGPDGKEMKLPLLEEYVKKDILDVIAMSDRAKEHFQYQADRYHDAANTAKRSMEEYMIKKRIERSKLGDDVDIFMDDMIMSKPEYTKMAKATLDHPPLRREVQMSDKEKWGVESVGGTIKDMIYGKKL